MATNLPWRKGVRWGWGGQDPKEHSGRWEALGREEGARQLPSPDIFTLSGSPPFWPTFSLVYWLHSGPAPSQSSWPTALHPDSGLFEASPGQPLPSASSLPLLALDLPWMPASMATFLNPSLLLLSFSGSLLPPSPNPLACPQGLSSVAQTFPASLTSHFSHALLFPVAPENLPSPSL